MADQDPHASATRVLLHLDRLRHNMQVLQALAGARPLWPAVKANAYGHGAEPIARALLSLGYETLCVARTSEAAALRRRGIEARFVLLSATVPEQANAVLASGCEPALCTLEMAEALSARAVATGTVAPVHIKIDTGMGRIGIRPEEVGAFVDRCRALPGLRIAGLMSHFPTADDADKTAARAQIDSFDACTRSLNMPDGVVRHMANSAALFDLPDALFNAARPGIAMYGLHPSPGIQDPDVRSLRPVLEWRTRITFLKEVPAGTGLSYGHAYRTPAPALIATVPVGYGDGLARGLSGRCAMLVGAIRCPQVGRITMDQCLLDVTALRGRVAVGDDVTIIGRQGDAEITADDLAATLGTINYEIVTAIADRVPRLVASQAGATQP